MNDEDTSSPEDARGDGYRRDATTTLDPVSATVRSPGLSALYRDTCDCSDDDDYVRVRLTVCRSSILQRA